MPLHKNKFNYPHPLDRVIAYDSVVQNNISDILSDDIYDKLIQNNSFNWIKKIIKNEILNYDELSKRPENIISNISTELSDQIKKILLKNNEIELFKKIWLTSNSTSHINKLFEKLLQKFDPQKENNQLLATIVIYAIAIQEIQESNQKK